MEIKDLTVEMVTPVIEAVVAEYGEDYVYKAEERELGEGVRCLYREDGEPSCIVGHVLDRLGVEYDPDWEDASAEGVLQGAPTQVQNSLGITQTYQDRGHTWGEALEKYRKRVAL